MNKVSLAAALAASALALSACGGSGSSGSADGEIMIGAVHPLTGALAGVGSLMNNGAQMAVDDINAAGGIEALDGAQLTLGEGDSKGVADSGQSEAQRLISEGAVALVGTYQSDVTANVSAVAERSGVPLVIDVAVDDSILEQGYQNTFRIQPNATSMGTDGAKALIALAEANDEPIESVSYIHIEGAFGQSVFDAFAEEAEANGVEVLEEVTYPGTNFTDATTQVREAAAADPDVIVATGYYPDSLLIAQAVEALGPDVDAVYGVANGGFDDGAFPGDAGQAGNQVLSANYHYAATDERVQDIRTRFEEEYGKPMETASMLSYQAVVVIAQALEEAGSDDPEAVREALAGIEVDDPLLAFDGPITFDETGQNENATVIVMQIQDGKVEQVFPEDFTTSEPVYPTNR
ncbi:ABC transporter substrate-binding protein [Nocardioides sp. Leaf307]|uniref:ABC transporter substrate-binding protein n=1 Tax=Nocardioides sp. Leaf307 TaxID=1736331 RepID=UPI000702A77C|nr:ABC transporter substrate-binding protein [Nocardioides sp. Leaf307]KQQ39548.1 ABC transporter substrate-binding protein [Nocardioides sp. Leaf307]